MDHFVTRITRLRAYRSECMHSGRLCDGQVFVSFLFVFKLLTHYFNPCILAVVGFFTIFETQKFYK
jgi:hypothetical protein